MRSWPARLEPILPALIVAAGLACFLRLVYTSYFIRAYSDSYNWLQFARHFGRELTQSRWPYGFPLFLRGVLELAGPYYVFLVNLPVLLVLFGLVAGLGRFFHEPGRTGQAPASWAFLSVWVIALAVDAVNFTRHVNPYRDPLSYVLLFASMAALVVALRRRRPAGLLLSGMILGLAASVREPSILMILPFALYGLWSWRASRGELPLVRSVSAFVFGLILALIPMGAQMYATTRQILLPSQSAIETQLVPGAHFNWASLIDVAEKAAIYYGKTHPWLLILAAIGTWIAVRRRQPLILALVLPAAGMYAVFYSFYWTFVTRYFYIVVLCLSVVAGYALYAGLQFIHARLPDRNARRLGWILLVAAAALSGRHVLGMQATAPLHRVPQARALARDLSAVLPPGAVVFAPRHLCEWIDWFMDARSYPLPLPYDPQEQTPAHLKAHIDPLRAAGIPLRAAEWPSPGMPQGDTVHLRRLYDLEPVASLDARAYHAAEYFNTVRLHRIQPWSRHRLEVPFPASPGVPHWFLMDVGYAEPDPATVTLAIDGQPYPQTIDRGGAFAGGWIRPASAPAAAGTAVLESQRFLPGEIRLATGALSEPMILNFGFYELFDHGGRWSGAVLPANAAYPVPRVAGEARFELPVPFPDAPERTLMEWRIVTGSLASNRVHRLSFHEGDQWLGTADIPRDRAGHSALIPLPRDPDRPVRIIRIVLEDEPEPDRPAWMRPPVPEFHRLILHRLRLQYPLRVILGSEGDSPYLRSGFSRREGRGGGPTHRWTTGHAVFSLDVPPTDRDLVVRVDYSTASVPPGIHPRPTAVRWNGEDIPCTEDADAGQPGEKTWIGRIPAVRVRAGEANTLEWVTPTWSPADYGSGDRRTLGVILRRLELAPADEPSPP